MTVVNTGVPGIAKSVQLTCLPPRRARRIARRLAALAITVSLARCSFSCIEHHSRDAPLITGLQSATRTCTCAYMCVRGRLRTRVLVYI